jgi:DNA-binding IclR family transcriptional regulator
VAELAKADPNAILKRQTRALMEEIHEQINETVNLGLLSGQRVKYLDYIETTRPLRMIVAPGSDDPWYRTALGRAIAAHLPPDEQTRLLAGAEFSSAGDGKRGGFTSRSMGAKLATFRAQGYAEEFEETVEGVGCLAVSLERLGFSFAGISVAVPLQRLDGTRKKQILKVLFDGVRNAKSRI